MTGLEGNRQIYLLQEIQDRLPKSIDRGAAKVNRNSWAGDPESRGATSIGTLGEAILNLEGQIDSLLPEGPFIICFIIPLCYSKEKMIILIRS